MFLCMGGPQACTQRCSVAAATTHLARLHTSPEANTRPTTPCIVRGTAGTQQGRHAHAHAQVSLSQQQRQNAHYEGRTIWLGLVTSVVNLKRQDIHLNRASKSTVPDTEKGTPCAAQPLSRLHTQRYATLRSHSAETGSTKACGTEHILP